MLWVPYSFVQAKKAPDKELVLFSRRIWASIELVKKKKFDDHYDRWYTTASSI